MKVKIELPGYETEELVPYSSLTKVYGVLQCLKRKHIENISKYTLYNTDSVALDPLRTLSSYNNIPVPLFLPFFLSSFPFFLSSSPSFPLFPLLFPLLPPFFALSSFSLLLSLFPFPSFLILPSLLSHSFLFLCFYFFRVSYFVFFPFLFLLLPFSPPFPYFFPLFSLQPFPSPFPLSLFPSPSFPLPHSPFPFPSSLSTFPLYSFLFAFFLCYSILHFPPPASFIYPLPPFPF